MVRASRRAVVAAMSETCMGERLPLLAVFIVGVSCSRTTWERGTSKEVASAEQEFLRPGLQGSRHLFTFKRKFLVGDTAKT